jgi:hypothetical protein
MAITLESAATKLRCEIPDDVMTVGTRIAFGDPGEGVITSTESDRVFLASPVYTGWIKRAHLRTILCVNDEA